MPLRAYFLNDLTRQYLANIVLYQQLWLPRVIEGQQWVGTVNPMLWTLVPGVLCCLAVPGFGLRPGSATGTSCGMDHAALYGRLLWPHVDAGAGLGRLGNPSYGLYLYAFPIQRLVLARLPGVLYPPS